MIKKKLICWVTPDCYLDTDLDYNLIGGILEKYNIYWIVMFSITPRFKETDFAPLLEKYDNLEVAFLYPKTRERYPSKLFEYLKISSLIKKRNPDIIYMNMAPSSPWQIPMFLLLPKSKTIITAHQGRVHEGMGHYKYYNFLRDIVYGRLKYVNMFSKSQALLFKKRYLKSVVYQFVLPLKSFGIPTNNRLYESKVRFLSFGSIIYTKSIETLIQAANILHERGVANFVISINGTCKDWNWYKEQIKYPDDFELDIRMIENDEIPNLFNKSHYLVQPYRVVSQSGPTKIAYYYNVPNITSNLPGFTDEMVEGVTGFCFETGNAESLADKMQFVISQHKDTYPKILKDLKDFVNKNYSIDVIVSKYIDMFDSILNKQKTN